MERSWPFFARRGVGEGDREGEGRLRDVRGVASAILPGVRSESPRLAGLWPIFAHVVISGTSEKALKPVSSTPEFSSTCVYCCIVRTSKLSLDARVVVRVNSDSNELLRVVADARGVCPLAALREGFNGDRLGVCGLHVDGGGGGIWSPSALPLRASVMLSLRAREIRGDSGRALRSGGVAGRAIFWIVLMLLLLLSLSCGTFSLSSMQSSKFGFLGVANISIGVCCCWGCCWGCSASLKCSISLGASHVLLISLLSASVMNGELGSLWSNASVLSSTVRGANGESISIESARFDRVECDWNTLWLLESGSMDVPRGKTQRTPSRFRGDDPPALPAGVLSRAIVKE